jgi:hypothetical protein
MRSCDWFTNRILNRMVWIIEIPKTFVEHSCHWTSLQIDLVELADCNMIRLVGLSLWNSRGWEPINSQWALAETWAMGIFLHMPTLSNIWKCQQCSCHGHIPVDAHELHSQNWCVHLFHLFSFLQALLGFGTQRLVTSICHHKLQQLLFWDA